MEILLIILIGLMIYNITIHILKLYESWEWCRGSVKAELLLIFIGVKRRVRNGK